MSAFKEIVSDFKIYAKVNLKIKTKKGKILPFEFNAPQEYIHERIEAQLAEKGYVRALILKGRQQGASTYTEGRFYWKTSTGFGRQAYILTHEQAATDNIFAMAKRYHDNTREDLNLKPSLGASNAKEMIFDKLGSGYKVGTAGSRAVGRSGTIQYFHGSEVAFWNNAEEHAAGVMQCIPDGDDAEGTEIILESTANGVGGKFYDMWVEAVNGENGYIAIFVPWFWSSEYRANADGFVPTEEELKKQRIYGVDNEQLAWRRAKIKQLGKDLCDQEYPYCWQDAFLSTGRKVFDKDGVANAVINCWKPIKRMTLNLLQDKFIDHEQGELKVWSLPEAGKKYVIGADVAEGLIHGDYSSADVLELPEGNQVAQWHGHIPPDKYANVLKTLGLMYNKALIGVEANNHGLTTNVLLRDSNYPNLYVQRKVDDGYSGEREQSRIGWLTTTKSKPYIIDMLDKELRDGTHGLACKETAEELQTYVIQEDGSLGAQQGCYDDRVMSRAIAGEMLRQSPFYKQGK